MTAYELAEYAGVSTRTVQRWKKDHGMPVLNPERQRGWTVDRHAFLNWACRRGMVRDQIKRPEAVRDLTVYHKAALWELMQGVKL